MLVRMGKGQGSGLYFRDTQLFQILPTPRQVRATKSWEGGASGSPVNRKHQSGSWESGENDPHLKAIQVNY